jgi:hypothetical protein
MTRKVLVGMPGYSGLTAAAAAGLFRCSADPDLARVRVQTASALLAHNCNLLWCLGLNWRRAGECTHFAMQHSDVEPEAHWLDTLLAEMDAAGLDVLGCVVPLKDERGLTSTAVDRTDGDTWRPQRRLTMAEVYALPETFTSDDVGGPLLLNTGLWVCRLNEWAEDVCFTIRDAIGEDPDGKFTPLVEPEDWHLSRQFHALGLKVGCTRKVRLAHRGPVPFPNTHAWGSMASDEDCIAANDKQATPAEAVA